MSIVGALILGDTAVSAGLISPPTVMIVALSSMTTFTVADLSNQISLLRLGMILMGALFGIFGIMLGVVWLVSYMASLDSYGAPFLAPLTRMCPLSGLPPIIRILSIFFVLLLFA